MRKNNDIYLLVKIMHFVLTIQQSAIAFSAELAEPERTRGDGIEN